MREYIEYAYEAERLGLIEIEETPCDHNDDQDVNCLSCFDNLRSRGLPAPD